MKKKSYSELLKSPKWQKKRLEILQRDNFECKSCTIDTEMLHVHHLYYDKNLLPWEYDNDDLITLCSTCHSAITSINKILYYADFGIETVSLVMKLIDRLEIKSIEKHLKENHPLEYIQNE